jgi:hypothetical protein
MPPLSSQIPNPNPKPHSIAIKQFPSLAPPLSSLYFPSVYQNPVDLEEAGGYYRHVIGVGGNETCVCCRQTRGEQICDSSRGPACHPIEGAGEEVGCESLSYWEYV